MIFDDCCLFAQKAIEERALADIRPTNDDDALAGVRICHHVQATDGCA